MAFMTCVPTNPTLPYIANQTYFFLAREKRLLTILDFLKSASSRDVGYCMKNKNLKSRY